MAELPRKPQQRRTDLTAPLPLGYHGALKRAAELHARGPVWTWKVIAEAMAAYHGFDRSAAWWRMELAGQVESRAHGNSFTKEAA